MGKTKILLVIIFLSIVLVGIYVVMDARAPVRLDPDFDSILLDIEDEHAFGGNHYLQAIAESQDYELHETEFFQLLTTDKGDRAIAMWGLDGSKNPFFIATFSVDGDGVPTLIDSHAGGAKGALNHQYIGNMRWGNDEQTIVLYDRIVTDVGGEKVNEESFEFPELE